MRSRALGLVAITLTSTLGLAGTVGLAQSQPAAARPTTAAKGKVPRTPWGDPDLQGVWDYKTITPLERPANFGDRQFLTDEEVARLEANAAKRLDAPPDETVPATLVHAPYMTDPGRK